VTAVQYFRKIFTWTKITSLVPLNAEECEFKMTVFTFHAFYATVTFRKLLKGWGLLNSCFSSICKQLTRAAISPWKNKRYCHRSKCLQTEVTAAKTTEKNIKPENFREKCSCALKLKAQLKLDLECTHAKPVRTAARTTNRDIVKTLSTPCNSHHNYPSFWLRMKRNWVYEHLIALNRTIQQ